MLINSSLPTSRLLNINEGDRVGVNGKSPEGKNPRAFKIKHLTVTSQIEFIFIFHCRPQAFSRLFCIYIYN